MEIVFMLNIKQKRKGRDTSLDQRDLYIIRITLYVFKLQN